VELPAAVAWPGLALEPREHLSDQLDASQ